MNKIYLLITLLALTLVLCTKVDFESPSGLSIGTNTSSDSIAPTLNIATDDGSLTVYLKTGSTYVAPTATASDDQDGDLSDSIKTSGTVDENTEGTYEITFTVTDAAGNSTSKILKVIVMDVIIKDTIPPVVTLIGLETIEHPINTPYKDPGAYAIDNIDDTVDVIYLGLENLDTTALGPYVIGYTAEDNAGNRADTITRLIQVVEVSDNAPTITIKGANPLSLNIGDDFNLPEVTANDVEDGNISSSIDTISNNVNTSSVGSYMVIFSVTDSDENETKDTLIVNVTDGSTSDTIAPVITIPGDNPLTIDSGSTFNEPTVTALDETDGDVTGSISKSGTVDTDVVGTQKIVYTVSDAAGNVAKDSLLVNVTGANDVIAPIITIPGDNPLTLDSGATFNEPSVTALDETDGDVTGSISKSGTVDTDVVGSHKIVYTVSDAAGNVAKDSLIVIVESAVVPKDTVAPVITIPGDNPLTIDSGSIFNEPNVTALDETDGDVTGSITKTGSVDKNVVGSHKIVYTVSDVAGNVAKDSLIVLVESVVVPEDTIAPVITIPGSNPLSIDSGATFTEPNVTALDETDGDVTGNITKTGSVDTDVVGAHKIVYTVSDAAGNVAKDSLIVNVSSNSGVDTVVVTTSGQVHNVSEKTVFTIPSITSTKTLQIEAGPAAIEVTEYDSQAAVEGPITINPYQGSNFTAWGDEVIVVVPSAASTVRFTWW